MKRLALCLIGLVLVGGPNRCLAIETTSWQCDPATPGGWYHALNWTDGAPYDATWVVPASHPHEGWSTVSMKTCHNLCATLQVTCRVRNIHVEWTKRFPQRDCQVELVMSGCLVHLWELDG